MRYDPGNDFEEKENDQIPDLEPVNDETFQIIPHNEQIESSDDDDEGSAESNAEEGSSKLPEPPAEHFLITGLPKPISKSQKKKQTKEQKKECVDASRGSQRFQISQKRRNSRRQSFTRHQAHKEILFHQGS